MAYIQLNNPEIIDLAAMQRIIDVVNEHSDYLNVLVNKFGADYIPDWLEDDNQANFDLATTNIVHGQSKFDLSQPQTSSSTGHNGATYYLSTVNFDTGTSFSQPPRVIISHHQEASNGVGAQLDVMVSTHNVTTSGFTARAFRSGTTKTLTGKVFFNWIAIGPR